MSFFKQIEKDLEEELKKLLHGGRRRERTFLILSKKINQSLFNFIDMNLSLVVPGGQDNGQLQLIGADSQPHTEATFASIVLSGLDGTVATAVVDGSVAGQIDVSPVAVGTQTLTIATKVTYQDKVTSSQQTVSKTVQVAITVTAQVVLEATTLSIVFGPQAAS